SFNDDDLRQHAYDVMSMDATPIPVLYGVRMDDFLMDPNATTDPTPTCALSEPYPLYRFVCIVVAGLIAIGGIGFNILLIALFANRSCATTPPTLYPSALAVLDTLMCICYVLLMFIDAIVNYLRVESLYALYYTYAISVYTVSKFVQLAIPYMLIFATLERLVWISAKRKNTNRESRYARIGGAFLLCAALRLPTIWALEVQHHPKCEDVFRSLTTGPSEWGQQPYWEIFDFKIMTFVQTFIPFGILVALNAIIVHRLKSMSVSCTKKSIQERDTLEFIVAPVEHMYTARSTHSQVRSAILTMVAIVTSYLLCNSLQLVLTFLEKTESTLLIDENDSGMSSVFHTSFGDIISFLYMCTSAIRLFIYAICNNEIRRDLRAMFECNSPVAFRV
ncbi:hypothetical protein PENTCL1PPCAC_3613, partial [Pristionchus entomophagus]